MHLAGIPNGKIVSTILPQHTGARLIAAPPIHRHRGLRDLRGLIYGLLDGVLALDDALVVARPVSGAGRLLLPRAIGVLRDLEHGLLQFIRQRAHASLILLL